jgi:hypothetical protein
MTSERITDEETMAKVNNIFTTTDYDELTDWEQNFFVSVESQVRKLKFITQRQFETLQKIFKEVNGGVY